LALPEVLKEIGRNLLTQFCDHFQSDLTAKNITLPSPDLPDNDYFDSLAALLKCPALLPDEFKETLFDIEEFATPEKSQFLKEAVAHAWGGVVAAEGICHERVALQLWLMAPSVLVAAHTNPTHLTAFEGFARAGFKSEQPAVPLPTEAALREMSAKLNSWFLQRKPDAPAARMELYVNRPGEYWFLVRHGDTCRWIYNFREEKAELIHFRPDNEDAIVYLADQNELWITAKTGAEREMYRQHFSLCLRDDRDYFSEPCGFSLEPLRTEGADALDPTGSQAISRMALVQLEVDRGGGAHETNFKTVEEILRTTKTTTSAGCFISNSDTLIRAVFVIEFRGAEKSTEFEICPPFTLELERASDLAVVLRLLSKRGFRVSEQVTTTHQIKAA
jgi:hypothetical protein